MILARHGESEVSVDARLNGDPTVRVGLTEEGRAQAVRLGEQLRRDPLGLCVTSEFGRVRDTAYLALDGRDVPRLVLRELNDPRYGRYEGAQLEEYRAWASTASSRDDAPGGGESRLAIVRRYVDGFRAVLARPERDVLVVGHSLPIAYVLAARDGMPPQRRVPLVEYAHPYRFERRELAAAVDVLEAWCRDPDW